MVSPFDSIEEQRLQVQINNLQGNGKTAGRTLLPYDPSAPPDSDSTTIVLAQNSLDNSDFDYSKHAYTGSAGADDDYECYNFFRQRFIKVTDVVTTAASNTITSASSPFKSTYTYPMDFVLLNGGASGTALVGYINRNAADNSAKLYSDAGFTTPLNVTPTLTGATLWFGETLSSAGGIQALKSSSHSLYAANEGTNLNIPRWDRTNGWVEIGSNAADHYDLATLLPINLIRAGVTYYFRCIISQRSGTSGSSPVRLSAGIWDATSGRQRFLESSNLDLSVTVVGTTGGTTYDYVILADLDDGRTIVSDTVTIANGNASLSTSNYNRLEWQNAAGVLRFRIYRTTGGVTKRIFTITNGAHDFNDYGSTDEGTVGSAPTAGEQRPVAYAVSGEIDPVSIGSGEWMTVLLQLTISDTYNASTTTGRQWLRLQIEGLTAQERMVLLDRVSLSTSNGGWNRSSRDLALITSTSPSSSPTDGGGQGGGGIDEGGCFTLDTKVIQCDQDGKNFRYTPIGELKRGDFVFSGANKVFRIVRPKDSTVKEIVYVTMASGIEFSCSLRQRVITSRADKKGTRIDDLTIGDEILSWLDEKVVRDTIVDMVFIKQKTKVRELSLHGGHNFIAGRVAGKKKGFCGAVVHNEKPIQ
jgi:hypothetical protein